MRIASLLVGLALVAQAACTRPTPGYCGGAGGPDSTKCGPGLKCNPTTWLCDRSDAGVTILEGGTDATTSDARESGADAGDGGDGGDGGGMDAAVVVPCDGPEDCAAGRSCVDGICCASPSCGLCQSCAIPGFEGTCTSVPPYMDDPNSSCSGDVTCDGFGGCLLKQGKSCARATECASRICVDSVCCENACTDTCHSCNQAARPGTCLPVGGVEDTNSTPTCSGTQICAPLSQGTPACKLKDGQTCTEAPQCANGTCFASYRDADMDGFGTNTPTLRCEQAPSAGYVTTRGDCCDTDGLSRPTQTTPRSTPNACGSYDWNCNGMLERPGTANCGCVILGTGMVCTACL